MIQLPPGCTVGYGITIDIDNLSEDIIDWYKTVGGVVTEDRYHDHRGKERTTNYVQYGKSKKCHYHHNGLNNAVRLHFLGEDASVASMFLLKFMEHIVNHNLKEVMHRIEYDKY
jgi:hypothetical protein